MEKFNNFAGVIYRLLFIAFCIGVGWAVAHMFDNIIIGFLSGLSLAVAIYVIFINWVKDENDVASDYTGDHRLKTQVNFLYNVGQFIMEIGHFIFRGFTR